MTAVVHSSQGTTKVTNERRLRSWKYLSYLGVNSGFTVYFLAYYMMLLCWEKQRYAGEWIAHEQQNSSENEGPKASRCTSNQQSTLITTKHRKKIKRYETKRKANKHRDDTLMRPTSVTLQQRTPLTASNSSARERDRERKTQLNKARMCVHERDKGPNL